MARLSNLSNYLIFVNLTGWEDDLGYSPGGVPGGTAAGGSSGGSAGGVGSTGGPAGAASPVPPVALSTAVLKLAAVITVR